MQCVDCPECIAEIADLNSSRVMVNKNSVLISRNEASSVRPSNSTCAAVRRYIYRYAATVQGQAVNEQTTFYVGTQTGLPRRAVTLGGRSDATVDFYDYGAKIDIQPPSCPGG